MFKISLYFSLFFLNVIFSQEINQLDEKGKKHGPWKGYYDDTKRLRYEGVFKHGKEIGLFTFYDNTKTSRIIATREFNEKDNAAYTIFYNGKFKVSEGKVVNKEYEGEWKYYHLNSDIIMTKENYSKGKLNGLRTVYYKNGSLAEEAMYKNGKKNGIYKKYAENGVILEESNYKEGEYHGKAIFKDADGKTVAEGEYKSGKSIGIWKYYKNGILEKEINQDKVKKIKLKKKK